MPWRVLKRASGCDWKTSRRRFQENTKNLTPSRRHARFEDGNRGSKEPLAEPVGPSGEGEGTRRTGNTKLAPQNALRMLEGRPKGTKGNAKSTQKRHKRAQECLEESSRGPPGATGRRPEGDFKKIQKISPRRGATLVLRMETRGQRSPWRSWWGPAERMRKHKGPEAQNWHQKRLSGCSETGPKARKNTPRAPKSSIKEPKNARKRPHKSLRVRLEDVPKEFSRKYKKSHPVEAPRSFLQCTHAPKTKKNNIYIKKTACILKKQCQNSVDTRRKDIKAAFTTSKPPKNTLNTHKHKKNTPKTKSQRSRWGPAGRVGRGINEIKWN